jgi:hypothetical protein
MSELGYGFNSLDNKINMWYSGRDTGVIASLIGYHWDIGYAASPFPPNADAEGDLNVYPNPATDKINIDLPYPNQPFNIQVFTLDGKRLMYTENSTTLDIAHFARGVYLLRVNQNGKYWTKKMQKQ